MGLVSGEGATTFFAASAVRADPTVKTAVRAQKQRSQVFKVFSFMVLTEGFSAAAGAAGVRVTNFKTFAMQAVIKVYRGAVEVGVAGGIDQDFKALALEFQVAVFPNIKGHTIFKARATPGLDEHAQNRLRISLLLEDADLPGSGFGEIDHTL